MKLLIFVIFLIKSGNSEFTSSAAIRNVNKISDSDFKDIIEPIIENMISDLNDNFTDLEANVFEPSSVEIKTKL